MSEKTKIIKPYEGHRERLRQRFEKSGLQGFHDYEVLALLLTFVIPRQDTKPIAKELINKFNNLQNIKGLKDRSAQFIKILKEIISYYFEERAKIDEIQFTKLIDLVDYLKATIGGNKNEVLRILYLNSQNKLIHSENLSEGTVTEAIAFPRRVVEGALKNNETSVIIANNHPGGILEPSDNDNAITEQIKNALKTVNIALQEHVIIADSGFYSYRQSGFLD